MSASFDAPCKASLGCPQGGSKAGRQVNEALISLLDEPRQRFRIFQGAVPEEGLEGFRGKLRK